MLIARKFARYFEVEARIIPVCKESNYCLDVSKIREHIDENTIGLSPWTISLMNRYLCYPWIDLYWPL